MKAKFAALKTPVSFGNHIKQTRQLETRTTGEVLHGIANGEWREPVERVRKLPFNSKEQVAAKKALPYATWAGTFKRRAKNGLLQHSGQIGMDLDHLTPEQTKLAMHAALDDPFCLAAFRSVRCGVRLLFRIPPVTAEAHSRVFSQVAQHVQTVYGIKPDPNCRDVCRASFVSYDAQLIVNFDAEVLPIRLDALPVRKRLAAPIASVSIPQPAFAITEKALKGVEMLGAECAPHTLKPDGGSLLTHKSLMTLSKRLALGLRRQTWPGAKDRAVLDAAFAGWLGKIQQRHIPLRGSACEYRKELATKVRYALKSDWIESASNTWTKWLQHPEFPSNGTPRERLLFAIRCHCKESKSATFYLSSRLAGMLAGRSVRPAAKLLHQLRRDKVIEIAGRPLSKRFARSYTLIE